MILSLATLTGVAQAFNGESATGECVSHLPNFSALQCKPGGPFNEPRSEITIFCELDYEVRKADGGYRMESLFASKTVKVDSGPLTLIDLVTLGGVTEVQRPYYASKAREKTRTFLKERYDALSRHLCEGVSIPADQQENVESATESNSQYPFGSSN